MTDKGKAAIRTAWPMLIGHIATWLLVATAPLGIELDSATAATAVGWALGTLVYLAGRWLERRPGDGRPAVLARWVGRFVLSLGLTTGQPLYPPTARP